MTQPAPLPGDAPFSVNSIPSGWSRAMTPEEVALANALYPVPPYGNTYFPPGNEPPPLEDALAFVQLSNISPDNNRSWASLSEEDAAKLEGHDTITVWPIAGRAGILDDLPARAVRITNRETGRIKINVDTDGLNLEDLVLLGVVYAPA